MSEFEAMSPNQRAIQKYWLWIVLPAINRGEVIREQAEAVFEMREDLSDIVQRMGQLYPNLNKLD